MTPATHRSHRKLVLALSAIVLGMTMLAFASVPLYRMFCAVTGFGGTTSLAKEAPHEIINRTITVQFNTDIDAGLPWVFKPGEHKVDVKVGENRLTYFTAENLAGTPLSGTATYNVTPHKAGRYFKKIQCFCFSEQTLQGHQKAHMPVSFFVDPEIMNDRNLDDISTITLSYTFFPVKEPGQPSITGTLP